MVRPCGTAPAPWRREDIIWLLTMMQEVRPYGAASCFVVVKIVLKGLQDNRTFYGDNKEEKSK